VIAANVEQHKQPAQSYTTQIWRRQHIALKTLGINFLIFLLNIRNLCTFLEMEIYYNIKSKCPFCPLAVTSLDTLLPKLTTTVWQKSGSH